MDVNLTTKVVSFGTGAEVDSGDTSLVLDDFATEEYYGEDKSGFNPGDTVWVLAYLDSQYTFVDCKISSGSLTNKGTVTRTVTEEVQIPVLYANSDGNVTSLQYKPKSDVSFSWYGNSPNIVMDENNIKAVSGVVPAIGEASYKTTPLQFQIVPPAMSLSEDEVYKILMVIYVE